MLEDLVILETIKSCHGRKNVQKAMFVSGDIDMVVSDPESSGTDPDNFLCVSAFRSNVTF